MTPLDPAAAFENGPVPTLAVDAWTGRVVAANAGARALLGLTPAGVPETGVETLFPGHLPDVLVFTEAVLSKGTWWTRTLSPARPDGRTLNAEIVGTLLPPDAPAGRPGPMLLAIHDLDARHRRDLEAAADGYVRDGVQEWVRAERLFREIEHGNQLILNAAGEGIFGVNAEGKTTFVNPAAARILGWRADEIVGKDMHDTIHHHHADGTPYPSRACPIYAAFRDGAVRTVENEVFWHRDGRPVWVEYTSTPIRDEGRLVGAVIVFRDVSRRREAEERLRAALEEVDRLRQRLERENAYLQEEIRLEVNHRGIIGRSAAIQKIMRQLELVAPTDATVLITGESGTGKELVARAIHEASRRRERPLIRVNCAAVPRELFESEFFGHVKGAFTGAVRDRVGRFELADGGTLFLDEVAELPLDLQGKLLRVLQEGQFERVGEERTRSVDVRLIAATNRDLRAEVRAGRFREDLYFRLAVFPIESVPLRERREDIPLLAIHFLKGLGRRMPTEAITLTEGDVRTLVAYDWPGNVRELENVIERAAILARNGRLHIDLPAGRSPVPVPAGLVDPAPVPDVLTEAERRDRDRANIRAALDAARGKIAGPGGAAERLGLRPTTLTSRMVALGLRARGRRPV